MFVLNFNVFAFMLNYISALNERSYGTLCYQSIYLRYFNTTQQTEA